MKVTVYVGKDFKCNCQQNQEKLLPHDVIEWNVVQVNETVENNVMPSDGVDITKLTRPDQEQLRSLIEQFLTKMNGVLTYALAEIKKSVFYFTETNSTTNEEKAYKCPYKWTQYGLDVLWHKRSLNINTNTVNEGYMPEVELPTLHINRTQFSYTARQVQHQGRTHIVVPVTMMVQGVHNGSRGAMYHSISELGKNLESWNGIPVVINHPQLNGQFVSANNADVSNTERVGTIYNARVEDTKLKADAYIDSQRLAEKSQETLTKINNNEILEVSVGVFTDEVNTNGTYLNENYTAIATNHRPDHLAILPNEVGACSVADGCGIRVNSTKEKPLLPIEAKEGK